MSTCDFGSSYHDTGNKHKRDTALVLSFLGPGDTGVRTQSARFRVFLQETKAAG